PNSLYRARLARFQSLGVLVTEQRPGQCIGETLRARKCVVDDQSTIDDESDAHRRPALPAPSRLQREMKHGDIERGGLARAGRQVEHVRPDAWVTFKFAHRVLAGGEPPQKVFLPRKRIETPDPVKERGKSGV